MWSVSQWVCLLSLAGVTVIDIKKKRIPTWTVIGGSIASVGYQMMAKEMDIWLIIGGVLAGVFFLLLSKITKEGIGYGDSLGILVLGVYLGIWSLIEVLCVAFFLLFFVAAFLFLKKKYSRKCGLPFYPFLAAGYLMVLIVEKGGI